MKYKFLSIEDVVRIVGALCLLCQIYEVHLPMIIIINLTIQSQ